LEDKLALFETMKQDSTKIISYQEHGRMIKVFNTNNEMEQKQAFLGKKRTTRPWKTKE
jgi:hypothetical protein